MFDPVIASKNIKEEFVSYISTSFCFEDENLRKQFIEQLNENISNGPYLEINDVFKSGLSINELIDEGILPKWFMDLEAKKPNDNLHKKCLPLDRILYLHQEQAIRTIVSGNNAVISTGTGSGKTNCFLIPVLNELLKEKEENTLGPGIRAIFIYPMNALANDQMKNIRKILMCYPDITFGAYNGGTEEDEEDAIKVYKAMFANDTVPELRDRLKNELLSRKEMKDNPPNILFTNYAMLEHLLLRPHDDILFSESDFRFVVLDEAHVYSGATGIETSLLLRRLSARIKSTKQTQFILTSATLGNSSEYDDDIVTFTNNLCGVEFKKENIIRSTRENYIGNNNAKEYPLELIVELANPENKVQPVFDKYGITYDSSKEESELIYDFVYSTIYYHKLRANISKVTNIKDIQNILGFDKKLTTNFILLCTRAKKNVKALIDARFHFFIRSLEGCFLAFANEKKLFLNRQKTYIENNNKYAVFEIGLCAECGKFALVGKIEAKKLVQVNNFDKNINYFYLAEEENDDIEDDEENDDIENKDKSKPQEYYLCPHCGGIVEINRIKNPPCDCPKHDYIKIVKAKMTKSGDAKCGNCHRGKYERFYLGNDAATSVLATSLYEELPDVKFEENSNLQTNNQIKKNIFFKNTSFNNKKKETKNVKQFLAFSDGRQQAAKFACYLEKSYQEFLRRRGIYQIISQKKEQIISEQYNISSFVSLLTSYFSTNKSFAESYDDNNSNLDVISRKNAWIAMLNELARFNSQTSLTVLGVLQFSYLGNTDEIVSSVAENYNVSKQIAKDLLDLLIFEIVKMGAIISDDKTDIDDNGREYIFYSPSQRFVTKFQEPEKKKGTISNWLPTSKPNGSEEYYKTNRLNYVMRFLNCSQKEAAEFLGYYFEYLISQDNNYHLIDENKDDTYVLKARCFQVKIAGDPSAKWYKCQKCGKVSQFNINGKCICGRCDGNVENVDPKTLNENNHFSKLYFTNRMSPLFIKEHTAQLSKNESATYQEQFIKKEINALSCSTTFEMGVDVGDLETVFLRDVPPLPSNYAQRAGRAGRSLDAAAYALTFAKLSSHDLTFFKNPAQMINGTILPPLFKIDNEKIARRHIYAIALSMFFKLHSEQYNYNDANNFINEKGYLIFKKWLNEHPKELLDALRCSIPNINDFHNKLGINDFSWLDSFIGEKGTFTLLIDEYENNIAEFERIIRKLKKENDLNGASKCQDKLNDYKNNKLIDFLARGNILPRYGFPVNTVELEQNTTAKNFKNSLRLTRDLQVAIAEYAPSSEVIANGKMYTSRYIKKASFLNDKKEWFTAYIAECSDPICKAMNYSITPITSEGIKCIACGKHLAKADFSESIEPRSGFVTERKSKDVPLSRQEKNYKSEVYYIGNSESKTIDKFRFKFNNVDITIESTTNDSLMIKSLNNFYVCSKCGFAYAEDEKIPNDKKANKDIESHTLKITTAKQHESLYSQSNCENQELYRYSLHHVFNTDVAKISFGCDTSNYETMISTMYAILYAICENLNIERKDINACLSLKVVNCKKNYSIIIYDAVPGGAGHSRRLVTYDGKMLYRIMQNALAKMENCNCEPSCYNCLRSYENQKIHDKLDRKLAINFLSNLTGEIEIIKEEQE